MHPDPVKCYLLPGANQVHALNVTGLGKVLGSNSLHYTTPSKRDIMPVNISV